MWWLRKPLVRDHIQFSPTLKNPKFSRNYITIHHKYYPWTTTYKLLTYIRTSNIKEFLLTFTESQTKLHPSKTVKPCKLCVQKCIPIKFNSKTVLNAIYSVSYCAQCWKVAVIIPIAKPDKDCLNLKSFRPIILLKSPWPNRAQQIPMRTLYQSPAFSFNY